MRIPVLMVALLLAACGKQPEVVAAPEPVVEAVGPLPMPLTLDEVMVSTIDFAADGIWRPASMINDGLSDQQWALVEQDAMMLIAGATLITTPGLGVDDPAWIKEKDWQDWSKEMQRIAVDARDAAREKDKFILGRAANQLADVCAACHTKYRPADPRGVDRFAWYPKREGAPD